MIKAEFIRSIELRLGLSHHEASPQVEQIITLIKDQVEGVDSVLISGRGRWKVRENTTRGGATRKPWRNSRVHDVVW